MNRNLSSFIKGIGLGVTMGVAIPLGTSAVVKNKGHLKKKIARTMKTVGSTMDSISYMLK